MKDSSMLTVAAQPALFEGFEDAEEDRSTSFFEFVRVSRSEEGLVLAFQAAHLLGISNQRVCQLADKGALSSWEFWGKRYYSLKELGERRIADRKTGGRPRRTFVQMAKVAGKVIGGMDCAQVGAALLD